VTLSLAAVSGHAFWTISLALGVLAALAVTGLLFLLDSNVARIERSVGSLLVVATQVSQNTSNIPQLEATAPVLEQIVQEAVVQDGYMNALTDGFGQR
jgi:hypothetical protein